MSIDESQGWNRSRIIIECDSDNRYSWTPLITDEQSKRYSALYITYQFLFRESLVPQHHWCIQGTIFDCDFACLLKTRWSNNKSCFQNLNWWAWASHLVLAHRCRVLSAEPCRRDRKKRSKNIIASEQFIFIDLEQICSLCKFWVGWFYFLNINTPQIDTASFLTPTLNADNFSSTLKIRRRTESLT